MFSKKDCLKINVDLLKISMKNVLNPIKADDVPENIGEYFLIELDGKPYVGKGAPAENLQKMKVVYGNETLDINNYKSVKGKVLEKGETIDVYIPNPGWKVGEEHTMKVSIFTDNPTIFSITREVSE
jgi:hypothetical protein